jgi:hypothetical protein
MNSELPDGHRDILPRPQSKHDPCSNKKRRSSFAHPGFLAPRCLIVSLPRCLSFSAAARVVVFAQPYPIMPTTAIETSADVVYRGQFSHSSLEPVKAFVPPKKNRTMLTMRTPSMPQGYGIVNTNASQMHPALRTPRPSSCTLESRLKTIRLPQPDLAHIQNEDAFLIPISPLSDTTSQDGLRPP